MIAAAPEAGTDSGWCTLFTRAIVHAVFLIGLSLAGEWLVVSALRVAGDKVIFTTFWAFSLSSIMLGTFPVSYLGVPLGMGLSSLSRDRSCITMTRGKRLTLAVFYLCLTAGMGQLTALIERHYGVHNDVDVMLLYPVWYLMIAGIFTIANRRRL